MFLNQENVNYGGFFRNLECFIIVIIVKRSILFGLDFKLKERFFFFVLIFIIGYMEVCYVFMDRDFGMLWSFLQYEVINSFLE